MNTKPTLHCGGMSLSLADDAERKETVHIVLPQLAKMLYMEGSCTIEGLGTFRRGVNKTIHFTADPQLDARVELGPLAAPPSHSNRELSMKLGV